MEHHHFSWVNRWTKRPCSIAMLVCQRVDYFTSYKPPFSSGFFQPSKELWFCRGGIKWLVAPATSMTGCVERRAEKKTTLWLLRNRIFFINDLKDQQISKKNHQILSGWWYTYLSEKYEFVSWDYSYQYIYIHGKITNVPNHQPDMIHPIFPRYFLWVPSPPTEPIWAHQEAQPDMWFDVKKMPHWDHEILHHGTTSKASATVTCRCHGDSWRRSVICFPP